MPTCVSSGPRRTCAGKEPAEADGRRDGAQDGSSAGGARQPSWAAPVLAVADQLSRYTVVSAVALAVDMSVFLALVHGATSGAATAGVTGYCVGLVVHFLLSTRFVFDAERSGKTLSRLFIEFVATGLVGVAITGSVIWSATTIAHLPALIAKVAAIGISFLAIFVLRRTLVFTQRPAIA